MLAACCALLVHDAKADPSLYSSISLPGCSTSAALDWVQEKGCVSVDSKIGMEFIDENDPSDLELTGNYVRFSSQADTGLAKLAVTIKPTLSVDDWVYIPGNFVEGDPNSATPYQGAWQASELDWTLSEAYFAAGLKGTVVIAGKTTKSVANTSDDKPYSSAGLMYSKYVGSGVRPSKASDLAGQALQVSSQLGGGHRVSFGIENLEDEATMAGGWSYAGRLGSAHFTLLNPEAMTEGYENLGVHTGGTLKLAPFELRTAVSTDRTGWVDWIGSAKTEMGMFTLAASGEYVYKSTYTGTPQQIGYGVGATADLTNALAVKAETGWYRRSSNLAFKPNYTLAVKLKTSMSESLSVNSELGVTGSNFLWAAVPSTYGETELEWSRTDKDAVTAKIHRYSTGRYKFTTGATRQLE